MGNVVVPAAVPFQIIVKALPDTKPDLFQSKPTSHFNSMKSSHAVFTATLIFLAGNVRAQTIYVPNADFGLPYTDYATNSICAWQTLPQPAGYEYPYPWDETTGVFFNNPDYAPYGEYIYNCDGAQAAFLFALPGVGIFQDYASAPAHAFNATFEVGKSYALQAGLIASTGFGESPGVSLQMSLYYRDNASNMVTIASTNIVYTTDVFTSVTNFVTFNLNVPAVQAGDAWAGQHAGIEFLSTVSADLEGGYWDLGNVQLLNTPALINPSWSSGQFGATLLSPPGQVFQILAATNLSVPVSSWTNVVTLTNVSGSISFVDPATNYNARFYQAQQVASP